MHIALDCRCVHKHMGGIGRVAVELARALRARPRGHRVSLIVGESHESQLPTDGVSIVTVEAAMIDERFEQIQLPSLLEELDADVYLNTTFSIPAIKTTRFQMSIIHDVVFEDRPDLVEPGLRAYLSRWSRFAAAEADHVLTVSDHARERIRLVYGIEPARISRVYNGISQSSFDVPDSQEEARVRSKFGLGRPFLLYIGTIEEKKGVRELLQAFRLLVGSGYPGDLVLAGGGGPGRSELERESREGGCGDRIRFLGYIDESDKKPLLMAASCFVYPSLYEGFGIPPLEAMALGVPCVVSDHTSLPEVVGSAALVAPVLDPKKFASVLQRGLNDVEFRRSAATAGPDRARYFRWEDSAAQVLSLCENLEGN